MDKENVEKIYCVNDRGCVQTKRSRFVFEILCNMKIEQK